MSEARNFTIYNLYGPQAVGKTYFSKKCRLYTIIEDAATAGEAAFAIKKIEEYNYRQVEYRPARINDDYIVVSVNKLKDLPEIADNYFGDKVVIKFLSMEDGPRYVNK